MHSSSSHPQKANPMNSNIDKYLLIPKSTHHPTNKKPHECGENSTMNISHL